MRSLVIGDLHFGIKGNSLFWLESQLNFVRDQIITTIRDNNIERIIFLGDLHDIRYSLNQEIGIELQQILREMFIMFPEKKFVFIAGNHDYYSPLEEFAKYNIYNLSFPSELREKYNNILVVDQCPVLDKDGSLYLPWYYTESSDHFDELLYNYNFYEDVKTIYCHADLGTWPGARIGALKGCPVYSGHIHQYHYDDVANLYQLGAALSLTFSDVNEDKYLYIVEDHKIVDKIKNITTPKFIRIYNEEIFDINDELFRNSYIQLCIDKNNVLKAKYVDQIKYIKTTYVDANIRVHVIDSETDLSTLNVDGFNTNIETYIEDNIPEHLDEKYNKIKNKINN